MKITNVVCLGHLGCKVDLKELYLVLEGSRYPTPQSLTWKNPEFGATHRLFSSGKIQTFGISHPEQIQPCMTHFAKTIESLGWSVNLGAVKLLTMSAVHDLGCTLLLNEVALYMGGSYEPELFPAAMFKKEGIHYTCYHTGKIVITGIKTEKDVWDLLAPTLLELELCTSN